MFSQKEQFKKKKHISRDLVNMLWVELVEKGIVTWGGNKNFIGIFYVHSTMLSIGPSLF